MNLRINYLKGSTINEKIKNIDTSNPHHIMWIYKNLIDIYRSGQLQDVLSILIHVNIEDYTYGCIIYDDICSLVFRIYDIKHEDIELKFIYKQDLQKDIDDTKMKEDFENSFFILCTPIMDCCLKQVVDVFTYIYRINYDFENINKLLDKYNKRSDILIELLLLKMKLSHQNKNNDGINDLLMKLSINEDTDSKLKNLLLEYEDSNLNFFIENICIYLEYKEDEDFLHKLIHYSQSGYKHLIIKNISINIYEKLKNNLEMNDELLKKGIYNYQYFIKWSTNCFKNLSVLKINDFVEISRLFINYYRKEKDNRNELIEILKLLIKLDISYVSEKIRINILDYIDEIIEDNPFINQFVIELSDNSVYKKVLVKKMGIMKYFSVEDKNKVIINLFRDFDLNWRYRKTLIEECVKFLDILGFKNNNWLNHFDNDKVFYIREMCKKVRQNLLERDNINEEDNLIKEEIIIGDKIIEEDNLIKEEIVIEDNLIEEEIIIKDNLIKEEIIRENNLIKEEIIIKDNLIKEEIIIKDKIIKEELNNEQVKFNTNDKLNEQVKFNNNEQVKINKNDHKLNEEDIIDFNNSNILNRQEVKSKIQNKDKSSENKKTVTDEILDKKPLENNDVFKTSSDIKKDEIFEKLKNNVKNKIKSIEEKIVFVSENKNEK